jgi:anti-sigma regulatory factor (Ser/Thr protein kinase)
VSEDEISITIANRGLRLGDKRAAQSPSDQARRGWGLKLMRSLMDEVAIEETDDGTKVTMVKRIERAAA